jgi:parallel beta-helix repeat protein
VIGMGSYHGAYLTATSTYYDPSPTANLAQYGIFSSNSRGPGVIEHSYASNMSDSGFYVGACPDCNAVLSTVHAQNNAQGFSGSNAGGHLVLENSEWDHNQAGIVPSALASFDLPSPQNGACPSDPDASCTLIQFNFVHDNNNPNTPAAGLAATVPVGTGIDLTGGRSNTVQYNVVTNNGSWGIVLNDYADYTPPPNPPGYCQGGVQNFTPPHDIDTLYVPLPIPCYYHSFGNRVVGNVMWGNGSFGNPSNGDLANAAVPFRLDNCFSGNADLKLGSPTSSPANLQDPLVAGVCGRPWKTDTSAGSDEFLLTAELGCASLGPASGACTGLPPPLYPLRTQVKLFPNPHEEGMENPCEAVPQNSWCPQ